MTKKIKSNLSQNEHGNQFSPVVIDGNGIVIRNASDERLPDGTEVPAGSQTLMLVSDGQNSLFNASFIRTGVLDASLLRSGMIQVSPSWNNKFIGNVKDNYNLLQIYSGGALKATAVSTTTNAVTLTLGSGHGFSVNDYIRVSGIIFSQDGSTGDRGMNTAKFGELNYGQVTGTTTTTVTYGLTGVGASKTLGINSTAYASKAVVVNQIIRIYTDDDDQNALETAKCTVTTATAHGLAGGDYVEIAGTSQEFNGIWRVDSAPSSTTFVFYQKYADDEDWYNDFTVTMPTYGTPVALKLSKAASISTTGAIVATGAELNPGGPRQSALLLQGAATEGDIAVPATNTLHVGYRTDDTDPNESTFTTTMKMQMPSTGNYADTTFYGTVNIPLVLSVGSITGAATAQFTGSVGNDINIYSVSATSGYFDELTVGTSTANKLYVSKPGVVSVGNDTNATNATTGAVIVDGGVGIAKDLYVGGTLFPTSLDLSGTLTVAALNATTLQSTNGYFSTIAVGTSNATKLNVLTTGAVDVQNTNPSVSSTTGAVTVAGGVGIAKDLYVAGTIYPTDISMGTFSAGLIQATSLQATNGYFSTLAVGTNNTTKLNVTSGGKLDIQNTTPSATTTSGALTVAGGVGIAGNLYVGGTLVPTDLSMGTITASLFQGNQFEGTNGYFTTVAASTASFTRGTIGSSTPVTISSTGNVAITDTTDSTSTTTGALKVTGGASVAKNLYVGGTLVPTDLTLTTANATTFQATNGYFTTVAASTASFTRGTIGSSTPVTISSSGNVAITDTTDATSTTTGALKITGGASVQKNLYVGGTLVPTDISLTTINATTIQATNGYFSNLGTVNAAYLSAGTTTGAKLTVDKAGLVQINNNTDVASSTATSGAVSMDGGLYVAKNARVAGTLWVGNFSLPGTVNATTFQATNGYFTNVAGILDAPSITVGATVGAKFTVNSAGTANFNLNTDITSSSDTTGAVNIDGGLYVAKNARIGGTLWVGDFALPGTVNATTFQATNGYFSDMHAGQLLLKSTSDVTLTSTAHAFTIGTAYGAGTRLVMDQNEIMAINSSNLAATLTIQKDEGVTRFCEVVDVEGLGNGYVTIGNRSTNNLPGYSTTAGADQDINCGWYISATGELWGTTYQGSASGAVTGMVMTTRYLTSTSWQANKWYKRITSSTATPALVAVLTVDNTAAPTLARTSDYRLKENVQDADITYDFEHLITSFKVRTYKLKGIESELDIVGFIAHEVAPYFASNKVVEGDKDAVNPDGTPSYQMLSETRMIPFIVGAIQSMIPKLDSLKQQVEDLEARVQQLENSP